MKNLTHRKCLDCSEMVAKPSLRCNPCAFEARRISKNNQDREYRRRKAQEKAAAARANDDRRVVVQIDEDGELSYFAGTGVELFVVDERAPNDRVYRWSTSATPAEIDQVLSDDPIGHRFDDSEAARKLGQRLN